MGHIALNNTTLNKYFGILDYLDDDSKKSLIIKLTKSINTKPKLTFTIDSITGAWQDDRTADEIIEDIENARYNNRTI